MKTEYILALDALAGRLSLALGARTAKGFETLLTEDLPAAAEPFASLPFLSSAVVSALQRRDIAPQDLVALGVGTGPATFSAGRTSIAFAQGLALGLELPCYAVNSAQAVAQSLFTEHGECELLCVLSQSRAEQAHCLSVWRRDWQRAVCELEATVELESAAEAMRQMLSERGISEQAISEQGAACVQLAAVSNTVVSNTAASDAAAVLPPALAVLPQLEYARPPAEAVWHHAVACCDSGAATSPLQDIQPLYWPGTRWKSAKEQLEDRLKRT